MSRTKIQNELFALQDKEYQTFQSKLIPGADTGRMIGVRTPDLRALAKKLKGQDETERFLKELPHKYFDEDQLHAFIISEEKDFEKCVGLLEAFLPFVDNWATCDQMSPKVFRKHTDELLPHIQNWLKSDKTYTVRFGIGMLMEHYLGECFDLAYPDAVAALRSAEYYVNMMIAWYFATALAKQYDAVIPYIENRKLDVWCHNKAIQKSIESRRITDEQKEYLRSLKIR
ncbi:MAG: DNA alkylation repair protein [Clostridia bacterium]|nr:DNA alkylation repair protein [Clostridia bacterium]